jgi:hypothetical protein
MIDPLAPSLRNLLSGHNRPLLDTKTKEYSGAFEASSFVLSDPDHEEDWGGDVVGGLQ